MYNPMEEAPTEYVKRGGMKFASITHPLSKACQEFEMKPHKWLIGGEDGYQAENIDVVLTDFKYGYTDADKKNYMGAGKKRPFYATFQEAKANHDDVADYCLFEGIVGHKDGAEEFKPDENYDYAKFEFQASKAYPFQKINKNRIMVYEESGLDQNQWPVAWHLGLEMVEARGSKYAKPIIQEVSVGDEGLYDFAAGLKAKYTSS